MVVEALEVAFEVVGLDDGKVEDGAHGDADGSAPEGVGAGWAEDEAVDTEGGGDADECAEVFGVVDLRADEPGGLAEVLGHDVVECGEGLASAGGDDAPVELEADDVFDLRLGQDVDGGVGRESLVIAIGEAFGGEQGVDLKGAGGELVDDVGAFGDEQAIGSGEAAVFHLSEGLKAGIVEVGNRDQRHGANSLTRV